MVNLLQAEDTYLVLGGIVRKTREKNLRNFRVRILDFSHQFKYNFLHFKYITYAVRAKNEKDALKKAKALYMNGEEGIFVEELPIILKLFTLVSC